MIVLPVTLAIGAGAALLNLWLSVRVAQVRIGSKVLVGDGAGEVPRLVARMRAHANYVEYTPFVLILIGSIELARGPASWLWATGLLYLAGRLLHPFGLERGDANMMRAAGILLTWAVLVVLAGSAAWIAFAALR